MSSGSLNQTANDKRWMMYPVLVIIGLMIILLCSLIQNVPPPGKGEYYYSSFLRKNFTLLSNVLFLVTGLVVGYLSKLNPWYSGICLFLVFPVTSIIEATVYKGSHNLIPFELIIYFLMAIPTVIAVYIGRFIRRKVESKKGKHS